MRQSCFRTLLVCALAAQAAGCVALPIPHLHQYAPEVEGRVHRSGAPVSDLDLRWHASWGRSSLDFDTRSDPEGRFDFQGRRRFHPITVIQVLGIPHYLYRWDLCFDSAERGEVCWHNFLYTPGYAPRRLVFDCDLAKLAGAPQVVDDLAGRQQLGAVVCEVRERAAQSNPEPANYTLERTGSYVESTGERSCAGRSA